MIKTIYKCDACGAESQFAWHLVDLQCKISFRIPERQDGPACSLNSSLSTASLSLCRDCCKDVGITIPMELGEKHRQYQTYTQTQDCTLTVTEALKQLIQEVIDAQAQ